MKKKFFSAQVFVLVFLFLLISEIKVTQKAFAIPAFARKTGFSCMVCHSPSYPRLNSFGWKFKENGYQVDTEPNATEEKSVTKPEEYLDLLNNVPLALRIKGTVQLKDSHSNVAFEFPENVEVLSAGRIFNNISYFYSQDLGTLTSGASPIGVGFIQFNNLIKDKWFNIRFGKFPIFGWHFDMEKNLVHNDYLIHETALGKNPFTLGESEMGLEIYGRPEGGPLFYHAGIFESFGNFEEKETPKPYNNKDLSLGLIYNLFDNQRFGLFSYYGKSLLPIEKQKPIESNFFNLASSVNLDFDDLKVLGMYSYAQNLGFDKEVLQGGFLELDYIFYPNLFGYNPTLIGILRGDLTSLTLPNNPKVSYESNIIPALRLMLVRNVALTFEYGINPHDFNKNRGIIKIDTAF